MSGTVRLEAPAAALELEGVDKVYAEDGCGRRALEQVTFRVPAGSTVAVIGRSGSGKSTLLHLAAGIDVPTRGRVAVFGRSLMDLSERGRTALRRDLVGLVFQQYHLQGHLSVAENVALPDFIAGRPWRATRPRVEQLLERVGLRDRFFDSIEKLSGGEQQRVAICRALLRRPRLLLADEPTGNLDDETGRAVMSLLEELVAEEGATLVHATHSRELAGAADQILELRSGRLVGPEPPGLLPDR